MQTIRKPNHSTCVRWISVNEYSAPVIPTQQRPSITWQDSTETWASLSKPKLLLNTPYVFAREMCNCTITLQASEKIADSERIHNSVRQSVEAIELLKGMKIPWPNTSMASQESTKTEDTRGLHSDK